MQVFVDENGGREHLSQNLHHREQVRVPGGRQLGDLFDRMLTEVPPEDVVLRLNFVLTRMSRPFDSGLSKLLQSYFDRAIGTVHRDVDCDPKRRHGGEIRRVHGSLP